MLARVCVSSSVIPEMQNVMATWQTGLMEWSLDLCVHAGRWMFCSQRSEVNGCHIYNLTHSRFQCYHCVTTIEPYHYNHACNNRPISHNCLLSSHFWCCTVQSNEFSVLESLLAAFEWLSKNAHVVGILRIGPIFQILRKVYLSPGMQI
jgi:hypothetical protein